MKRSNLFSKLNAEGASRMETRRERAVTAVSILFSLLFDFPGFLSQYLSSHVYGFDLCLSCSSVFPGKVIPYRPKARPAPRRCHGIVLHVSQVWLRFYPSLFCPLFPSDVESFTGQGGERQAASSGHSGKVEGKRLINFLPGRLKALIVRHEIEFSSRSADNFRPTVMLSHVRFELFVESVLSLLTAPHAS